jgi:hypothetical protein
MWVLQVPLVLGQLVPPVQQDLKEPQVQQDQEAAAVLVSQ